MNKLGRFLRNKLIMESTSTKKITFITGNKKKLEEFQAIMSDVTEVEFDSMAVDLDEYQGKPEDIATK